ncbi:Murein biosynthesis integral membrane protein MurJ [Candidatus Bealeia paramacronuclearis]|uniref:Probable lipid II flippase MurJ n=1 Tax=Candidatus Bealeia paramacronuclearis TaxID=1921001 RepID=A0ABZ2C4C9_9PROT|nr:Murein biosynthesis integral membrane protein MurJ [Candidatus Bealeia paramacronuclearis]
MKLFRSIATVGGFTLLSRISGFVRDALIAAFLGVNVTTDAFFVAFKLPNFFRRFFAEGAFSAAFVPIFSGLLVTSGKIQAKAYADQVFSGLFLILFMFVLLFEGGMPLVITLIAPGFLNDPEKYQLAIELSRITFPYILFISLAAMLSGVLNSMGKFGAAAASPIILNITMIGAVLAVAFWALNPGDAMAMGVFSAGFLQLSWLYLSTWREDFKIKFTRPRLTPDIKKLIRLGIPGAVGAGVVQINIFIDTILASLLPTGAVSYLFYADRLNQLPLGVIGIAVSTALLPELSKQLKSGSHEEAHETQNRALEFVLAITLPAAMSLMVLSYPLVKILFERGAFTPEDALATSYVLAAFSVGLPAYVMIKVFSTSFFARHDTKTPVKVAMMAVGLNLTLNLILIGSLSYVGLALSTAIAAWFNATLLATKLYKSGGFKIDTRLRERIPRLVISTFIMGAFLIGLEVHLWSFLEGVFFTRFLVLITLVSAGLIIFGIISYLIKAIDMSEIKSFFKAVS